jgi:hypothetical protein
MWPFKKHESFAPLPPVVLTEEERQECQAFIRSFTNTDQGDWVVPNEFADSIQRNFISMCLMGRAQRFVILSHEKPEYVTRACDAAAKACAIFPVSKTFYEFGCVLEDVGKQADSKQMFGEFLRRCEIEKPDKVMAIALRQFDMESAVVHAREVINS